MNKLSMTIFSFIVATNVVFATNGFINPNLDNECLLDKSRFNYSQTKDKLQKLLANDHLESFRDEKGNTALHLALEYSENKLAEKIFEKYPDLINIENLAYESPIYVADKNGNLDGIRLCLEYHPQLGSNNSYKTFQKVVGMPPYNFNETLVV